MPSYRRLLRYVQKIASPIVNSTLYAQIVVVRLDLTRLDRDHCCRRIHGQIGVVERCSVSGILIQSIEMHERREITWNNMRIEINPSLVFSLLGF